MGDDAIRLGHALTGFEQDRAAGRVTVEFDDRIGDRIVTDQADLLVGADGIHSTVRRHFAPDEGPPAWSGNMLWRSTTVHEPFLTGRSMFMAGHRRHKFVAYPITMPDPDGRQVINWIAELDWTVQAAAAGGLAGRESWNRVVDRSLFDRRFAEWRFDWLDIPALIADSDDVLEFPMVDRDPLPSWVDGRVTLLGDAAHPMYPIGSNGASQAILDAQALADALSERPIGEALESYDSERRTATGAIVLANRGHGPEIVMDWAEERAPGGFGDVSEVFAAGELDAVSDRYKRVAGFTAPQR